MGPLAVFALCVGFALASRTPPASLIASDLKCENRTNPLGIETPRPRLSWVVESNSRPSAHPEDPKDTRDRRQTAYEIQVATTPGRLLRHPDLWDSGRVASDATIGIAYGGRTIPKATQVFWRVRVWDEHGAVSRPVAFGTWTTGADWSPQTLWIEAPKSPVRPQSLLLRHTFRLERMPTRALLFVCGLGQYDLYINGKRVGDNPSLSTWPDGIDLGLHLLSPGWTNYRKTCLYDTFAIEDPMEATEFLHPGLNVISIMLGNGMYHVEPGRYTKFVGSFGDLKAIAQFDLFDGAKETVVKTDETWKVAQGPITYSHVYGGEDYDARLLPQAWTRSEFDDGSWRKAVPCEGPGGALRGTDFAAPPIRGYGIFPAVSKHEISNTVSVYDLGQNASFMPRLIASGPSGSTVRIIPAELLKPDGTVDRSSMGGGMAYWQYTLDGSGKETYFPHFFYSGCRYLQVERSSPSGRLPVVEDLKGIEVHSSADSAGMFGCSSDLFNRIHTLVRNAQESNMMSVLTDCPHRERLGWLEQTHLNGPSLHYNFDLSTLFAKVADDIAEAQLPDGFVPAIAPEYVVFGNGPNDESNPFRNSPEWGSAFLLVPWQQYEFTGDDTLLRKHYAQMKAYVSYLDSQAKDGILDYGLGDWYDIGPNPPGFSQLTPRALTATAFYYQDVRILEQAAKLMGLAEWTRFRDQADHIRERLNARFYDAAAKQYAGNSQCGNSIALVMGLAPQEDRKAILDAVVADVQKKGLTAGDVGYRYLLRALADGGRSDVIFKMNNQTDRPGYGYQIAHGATSLTEAWDAGRSSSQNHFMLGQIEEWFYHDLAGIQNAPGSVGFKHILIKPALVDGLEYVYASYRSVRGRIVSAWRRTPSGVEMNVTIPINARATIIFPPGEGEHGRTSAEVGSGDYRFELTKK